MGCTPYKINVSVQRVHIRTIDFWGFPRSDLRGVFVRARRHAITVPPHGSALPCLAYRHPATRPRHPVQLRSWARAARCARCSSRHRSGSFYPARRIAAARRPPDRDGQEGRHQRGCIAALAAPRARLACHRPRRLAARGAVDAGPRQHRHHIRLPARPAQHVERPTP